MGAHCLIFLILGQCWLIWNFLCRRGYLMLVLKEASLRAQDVRFGRLSFWVTHLGLSSRTCCWNLMMQFWRAPRGFGGFLFRFWIWWNMYKLDMCDFLIWIALELLLMIALDNLKMKVSVWICRLYDQVILYLILNFVLWLKAKCSLPPWFGML